MLLLSWLYLSLKWKQVLAENDMACVQRCPRGSLTEAVARTDRKQKERRVEARTVDLQVVWWCAPWSEWNTE